MTVCDDPRPGEGTIWCPACGQPYKPEDTHWWCPNCGWKESCCEGEPAQ